MEIFLRFGYWLYIAITTFLMLSMMFRLLTAPRYTRQSHLVIKTEARAFRFFEQKRVVEHES